VRYPTIHPLGHRDTDGILSVGEVVLLEKIDGANFRWTYDPNSGSLLFGSRRHLFKEYDDPAPIDRINKQFRHAVKYIENSVDEDEVETLHEEEGRLWFFGEALHKHSLDYDAWDGKHPNISDNTVPNFLGFDVYSEANDAFLSHDEVVAVYERLGLDTVPVFEKGEADEFEMDDIEVHESVYRDPDPDADDEDDFNRKGLAEGVVIKNDSLDLRAKVVAEEFDETKWSAKTPEEVTTARKTAGLFLNKFVTDARVQKQAHKLVDEGYYDGLEMPMMGDLPRRVASDVFAEQGWAILNDDELELTKMAKDEIRSQLSRRCSRVLQQMIQASE